MKYPTMRGHLLISVLYMYMYIPYIRICLIGESASVISLEHLPGLAYAL